MSTFPDELPAEYKTAWIVAEAISKELNSHGLVASPIMVSFAGDPVGLPYIMFTESRPGVTANIMMSGFDIFQPRTPFCSRPSGPHRKLFYMSAGSKLRCGCGEVHLADPESIPKLIEAAKKCIIEDCTNCPLFSGPSSKWGSE